MGLSKADKSMLAAMERGLHIKKDGTVIGTLGRPITGSLQNRSKKDKSDRRYLCVRYKERGCIYFHRLQAYTKFGDALFEDGVKTRHGEGGPLDNSWDNINIGTHSDNVRDIPAKERRRSSMLRAKLSDEQILEIRAMREETGLSYAKIAKKYGVSRFTIWRYCRDVPLSEARTNPGR